MKRSSLCISLAGALDPHDSSINAEPLKRALREAGALQAAAQARTPACCARAAWAGGAALAAIAALACAALDLPPRSVGAPVGPCSHGISRYTAERHLAAPARLSPPWRRWRRSTRRRWLTPAPPSAPCATCGASTSELPLSGCSGASWAGLGRKGCLSPGRLQARQGSGWVRQQRMAVFAHAVPNSTPALTHEQPSIPSLISTKSIFISFFLRAALHAPLFMSSLQQSALLPSLPFHFNLHPPPFQGSARSGERMLRLPWQRGTAAGGVGALRAAAPAGQRR
jgi:hypothetical protein